jgi:hypothetical protein
MARDVVCWWAVVNTDVCLDSCKGGEFFDSFSRRSPARGIS